MITENEKLFKYGIPEGWWERFGIAYLDDLNNILTKYNLTDKFKILQCKEKYGGLRVYHNGMPEEWFAHERAWEYISEHTCVYCGTFPVPMRYFGWVSPYCDYHAFKVSRNSKEVIDDITEEDWDGRVQEYLIINHHSKDDDDIEYIDMKPFYDKIGWKYTNTDLILKNELEEKLKKKEEEE